MVNRVTSYTLFVACMSTFCATHSEVASAQDTPVSPARSPLEAPALGSLELPGWLNLSGELRFRSENRYGLGFQEGSNDGYGLVRTRINVGVRPNEYVRLFFQGQDSRAPGIRPASATGVFRDPFDVRQAYVEIGRADTGPLVLTVGRQLLGYGEQRLIGPLDWANTSRSFDAIKLEVRTEVIDADIISASVVQNDPARRINLSAEGNNLHGLYTRIHNPLDNMAIEPFLFWQTDPLVEGEGSVGDMDRYSGGFHLMKRDSNGWDYAATVVKQWGNFGDGTIDAWSYSVLGGYTADTSFEPRVFVEYNYASGDADPTDGIVQSFDDLYPTAHIYYGHNDIVGLRNIKNLRLGYGAQAFGWLALGLDFHAFWLADAHDNLYNVFGVPVIRVPDGGAESTRVRNELDFSFSLPVGNTLTLAGGLGRMFPGPFLEQNSPGDANTFTYLMAIYRF